MNLEGIDVLTTGALKGPPHMPC